MRVGGCLMLLAVLTAAGCLPAASDSGPDRSWFAAVGNANNVTVAVPIRVGGGAGFQYWQRDARGMWHGPDLGQGDPAALAAWREDLLVFFSTGRYGLFNAAGATVYPSPASSWTPVAACEDGLAADAFGWDTSGDPVHARFEDGRWSWRRIEVALEREKVIDPCAVRFAGRLFLFWREEEKSLTDSQLYYRLRFVYLDKGQWKGPVTSRLLMASAPHVAAAGDTMACLFLKPAAPPPWTLATYATTDEDWHEVGPLSPAPEGAGPVALARQGSRFFVAALVDRRPQVAPLDVPAARLGDFGPVAVAAGRDEGKGEMTGLVVLGLTVTTLLFILATWRRARVLTQGDHAAPRATGLVPAPLSRRMLACALDYLLIGLPLVPLLPVMPPDAAGRLLVGEQGLVDQMLLFLVARLVLVLVYFTVAEAAFGRTLGKHLLGLEVRTETGGRMTLLQSFIRNILRLVDEFPALYLLGLVLILVGPRPQRLGDRLARTLVVMRTPGQAPPQAS